MPLYNFFCETCNEPKRKILTHSQVSKALQLCPKCSNPLTRTPEPPSTQVIERLDNGVMPRAVERLRDAERLFKDRAKGPAHEDK